MKLTFLLCLTTFAALAQSRRTNEVQYGNVNQPPATSESSTAQGLLFTQLVEESRHDCIKGRRFKIIKILPDGLVVDSGYTDLLRAPLERSWLVLGTVSSARSHDLVEGYEPNSLCIGLRFLSNIPESRGVKHNVYDYVMIEGYPAGQGTYTSVANVHRTVRKFSANLNAAVNWNLKNDVTLNTNSLIRTLRAEK